MFEDILVAEGRIRTGRLSTIETNITTLCQEAWLDSPYPPSTSTFPLSQRGGRRPTNVIEAPKRG